MEESKVEQKVKDFEWTELPWKAWGSWFSWGSPIGLGFFLVCLAVAFYIVVAAVK